MKRIVITLLSIVSYQLSAFAQGPLTPPGAPAPTMKTLQQVQPRTPITNTAPVTISTPGSYYLTTNIISGDPVTAITIGADNVTLDLNGFSLISTNPSSGAGNGVLIATGRANVTIINGHISGSVTQAAGVFGGSGFASGIFLSGVARNVRVSGVSVSGCLNSGIQLLDDATTVVEDCSVQTVGLTGIWASTVKNCVVKEVGGYGIRAYQVSDSRAETLGSSYGIYANTVLNSFGRSYGPSSYGIYCDNAQNSYGYNSVSGTGLFARNAQNCYGYGTTGSTGLVVNTAQNCYGYNSGSGVGLSAELANNCRGESVSGIGLNCIITANGCYGITGNAASPALKVTGTANSCGGANTAGGTAIQAGVGIACGDYGGTNSIPAANKFFGTL